MASASYPGRRTRVPAGSGARTSLRSTGSPGHPVATGSVSKPPERPRSGARRLGQIAVHNNIWMVVLLVIMVGKAGDWVPLIKGLPVLKIAFVVGAIYVSSVPGATAAVRVQSLPLARLAIAFLTLSIVSVTFSILKSATLSGSYLSVILMITFVLLLKTTQTLRDVERLLIGLAVAGSSLSIAVLIDYHGGRAHLNSKFDANDLAYSLVTLLPIVLALRGNGSGARRILVTGLVVAMGGAILLTASRGGALGLLVVLLAVAAFPLQLDKNNRLKGFHPARLVVSLGVTAVLLTCLFALLPASSQEHLLTLIHPDQDYNTSTTLNASRLVLWRRDFKLALERPIGYGMGTAQAVDGIYGHGQYRTTHNSVIQAFVELGALGLCLFLASYYVAWRGLGRISTGRQRDGPDAADGKAMLYARALRVSLLGNFAAGFFLSQAYSASLWLTLAIICAFIRIDAADHNRPAASGPSDTRPKWRRRRQSP